MAERHKKRDALKRRWEKLQEKLHEKVDNYQAGLEKNTIATKFMSHLMEEFSSTSKAGAHIKIEKDAIQNDVHEKGVDGDQEIEKSVDTTEKHRTNRKSIAEANSEFLKELQAEANTTIEKEMQIPEIYIDRSKTASADNLNERFCFKDEKLRFKGQKVFYINNRLSVSASHLCGYDLSSSSSESNLSCYSSPDHESRLQWLRAGSLPPEGDLARSIHSRAAVHSVPSHGDLLQKIGEKFPKLMEQGERFHRYLLRNTRLSDVNKRLKAQIWSSVVTIVLVEAKNLLAMDLDTGSSDPYCKFRLGNEKYKSKVVWKTLHPSWLEQFDLHLYDDQEQVLEVTVWDKDKQTKDDFLGRCTIDLSRLEREKTHSLWQELEDGNGQIFLLLTISGTTQSETITDLTSYQDNPRDKEAVERRYAWYRLNESNSSGVGWLCVKVHGAKGLAAADLGGKSDPFCVLELGNARLQTHTEYKTLAPNWMKIFTFTVKDITSILEITVYDEDHDHKVEFLGKLCIPLLSIKCGEKRWYALKDKKMRARAKGNYPQILLEMLVIWNPVNAAIRALNPKEEKYMQLETKFKRQVFIRNVMRLKSIIMWFLEVGKILQDCFEWESRVMSFFGLMLWLVFCYYFQMWMVPVLLLILLGRNWLIYRLTGGNPLLVPVDDDDLLAEEDDDDPEADKEEKKSLKERLHAIQEVTQTVQNAIGYVASLGEAVKNLVNFTVPYLSYLAILLLFAAGCVLYIIPLRYLLMAWGVNKFTRKILRPHTIPNNEVLDLLSRVPDDEILLDCRELKPHPSSEHRRDARKKHKAS